MRRTNNNQKAPREKPRGTSIRVDSFSNSFIGHNTNKDPMSQFMFTAPLRMTDQLLSNLFIGNGLARKIISLPADEATKHWISIKADKNNYAIKTLDRLGAEESFADGIRWSRLYGGSAILMIANDGGTLEDELDEENLQEIEQLRVYDKTQIFWNEMVLYDDPCSKKYGKPQYYQINPVGGMPFMVHESRLLLFTGDPVPDYQRIANQGWGLAALQGLWEQLLNSQHSMKLAIAVMERKGQAILRLSGLLDVLEMEDGDEQVKARLNLIDMARSIMNTIAIDREDEFKIENLSISGMPDLIDRFGFDLSAVANIPFVILFGHNPKGSGLAQSGGTDLENWYNFVGQIQKRLMKMPLYRLVKLIMLCKQGCFRGKELENWDIEFNPLWSPSEKEQAEAKQANADADFKTAQANSLNVTNKIVSREECRRKAGYSPEEINTINSEVKSEGETELADVMGHSFADPQKMKTQTNDQPPKV